MKGRVVYGRVCRYFVDDREVSREEFDRTFPPKEIGCPGGHLPSCWPKKSLALSCHPKQVKAASERAQRLKLGVEYNAKGECFISDRGARRDLMKVEGCHDNEGGYGD